MTSLLWLRRDLRRSDLPALRSAADATGDDVGVVFVVDPALWKSAGTVRRAWLATSVEAAVDSYDGHLAVLYGDSRQVIPQTARRLGATSVHVSRETTPFGARRDREVAKALQDNGIDWVETGTPYAIGPGVLTTGAGTGFKVFTAFRRAWNEHGAPGPAGEVDVSWRAVDSDEAALTALQSARAADGLPDLPDAGEGAALRRWRDFLDESIGDYDTARDRPDLAGTSGLSPYLKVGAIHPRTLLADLASVSGPGRDSFVSELAWREFYADVLWRHPRSAWHDLTTTLGHMSYDEPGLELTAWQQGRTGYPLVDAGMRQLVATGWMHNRVRMVAASFLTKDLHLWWPLGARFFLDRLIDGDVASNNHGWQWVAGTGTDASPYFRVFNPVTQGKKFDPDGDYVRRWVPELRHLSGGAAHEPWRQTDGYREGYPERIVDHAVEREVSLSRLRGGSAPPAS
ncbi:deoxyribodipyrimidine photo-lyase [Flexivirga endophytica]|uniref:Deoxyribodipyrimidine photo-lyase n=1 Tax=Flexivirga endophytica TaxID=1849103 RepID=A0A916T8R3_9MICO|nr:deoxyribodipyrimidine photo-lyase [Flexivirga endophytica]GGB33446.1 deoxyribodipyrimidine photo-lyase [Flexivirga endophytica]GHB41444.1 deoxyribodipyrimidine photo-lyase [Flexivirga endophytica]